MYIASENKKIIKLENYGPFFQVDISKNKKKNLNVESIIQINENQVSRKEAKKYTYIPGGQKVRLNFKNS